MAIGGQCERDALRVLVAEMWQQAEKWSGSLASSHFRSEIAARLKALSVKS